MLGIFAGLLIRNQAVPDPKKVLWLMGAGAAGVALGFLWGLEFPVIKKIWTSSYVLVAGGFSALLLGAFYWIVDIKQWRTWCQPFVWIGMNAITIYLIAHFVKLESIAECFTGGEINATLEHVHPGLGALVTALLGLGFSFLICWFLFQRKIFLRV